MDDAGDKGLRIGGGARGVTGPGLELPRGREVGLSAHGDRRLKLATMLLVISLAFSAWQLIEFYSIGTQTGAARGDYSGWVVDETTDAAVDGAIVSIDSLGVNATTNATGAFVLHNVTSGRQTVTVTKSGYLTTSFVVYVVPTTPGETSVRPDLLKVAPGAGTETQDLAGTRDWWLTVCVTMFLIGIVLNIVGVVAVIGRRRYRHAMLGPIGAIMGIGLFVGALVGLVAGILIWGGRDQFADKRSLFGTEHDMPFPRAPSGDEDEEKDDEEEGKRGGGASGSPGDAPAAEGAAEVKP